MTKLPWSAPVFTEIYPDPNDKTIIAVTRQDCDPILEENKVLRDQPQKSDWRRLLAQVPLNVYNEWLVEAWTKGNFDLRGHSREFQEMVWKKINDPNYKYLRVDK